ncbi:MAG: type I pullulanase [Coprobacillaceae bacterium]
MNCLANQIKAYMIDLTTIEILVSKQYYGGIISTFYLREEDVITLESSRVREDNQYTYYQASYAIDFTKIYDVIDAYGLAVVLQYTTLVSMPSFDTVFYYNQKNLGATYYINKTIWRVWAPTALSVILKLQEGSTVPMYKNHNGVFTIELEGDYDGASYTYLINHDGSYKEALDPYSYSSIDNGKASVVINTKRCYSKNFSILPPMSKKTEAIIYEVSIHDFTMDKTIGCKYPGKYLGMIEENLKTVDGNAAGIDYIEQLGVTHVQIMPMYDFATVEENHPNIIYNWGYNPLQYNVPEGSYSTNPKDPYSRIIECQQMIDGFHKKGIRVVMDVVYNHMFNIAQCAFETIVPGYFFRKYPNGSLSNGSWVGNEVRTDAKMVQKYLIDISSRWQQFYGIDGLRFDLMGLIDTDTLTKIYEKCTFHDQNFIMYGEGWNMETALSYEKRGMQENHSKIPMVGFFNDYFRDKLKGLSGDNVLYDKGYFAGNMYNTEDLCKCLRNLRYSEVSQSINYVECHDNATVYDKYCISNKDEDIRLRTKRQKLLNMTCLLAQGIPFLHSGQECYRTKKGNTNSYCSNDGVNIFDWSLVDAYQEDINEIKKMITIRKKYSNFWYDKNQEVHQNIETKHINYQLVIYTLRNQNQTIYILTDQKSNMR